MTTRQIPIHEHTQDLSLGRIRWLEAGDGEPVLLLHGMGMYSSGSLWEHVIPLMAPRFKLYAPDWLGFGKGVREMPEGPTFELMLEHLREFMDARGLARAHVVGHSMGGWIAAQLAYQSPSRIEKLVMLCAAGMNRAPASGIRFPEPPSRDELREMFRTSMKDPAAADPAILDAVADKARVMVTEPGALTGIEPLLHQMETPVLRDRYMLQRRLPHITVPALMAWGEADFFEPYPTWNAEWDQLGGDITRSSKPWTIPGAKFARLATGHFPHVENPAATAKLLMDFLAG